MSTWTGQPLAEVIHPEVEFTFAWMDGPGIDALRKATAEWTGTFEDWGIEAQEVFDVGSDQVVAIIRNWGRPKGSEPQVHNQLAHLWTFRDGLAIRFEAFTERAEALEAAGISE